MSSCELCSAFSFISDGNATSKRYKTLHNIMKTELYRGTRCDPVQQHDDSTRQQAMSPPPLSTVTILSMILLLQPLSPIRASAIPNDGISSAISSTKFTKLSQTKEFQMLPRENTGLSPSISLPLKEAIKELKDLQDLQDERLDMCADRGVFWEQCFMFGERDEGMTVRNNESRLTHEDVRGRMDNQLISPMGALNPPMEQRKIPTW
ncbi:hypothetical protein ACHAXS_008436 [Conticribra weissflogii]